MGGEYNGGGPRTTNACLREMNQRNSITKVVGVGVSRFDSGTSFFRAEARRIIDLKSMAKAIYSFDITLLGPLFGTDATKVAWKHRAEDVGLSVDPCDTKLARHLIRELKCERLPSE